MTGYFYAFVYSLVLLGCKREAPPAPGVVTATAALPSSTATPAEHLDRLDPRKAVPLLPMMANHQKQNMRDHLVVVQEVVAALAREDFPAIQRAASRIAFSDPMGQMCTHMGAGAPGFSEQAITFHRTADTIAAAARSRDRGAVLNALSGTLQTCTSCHAAWKQQVVDQASWEQASSSPAPTGENRGIQP